MNIVVPEGYVFTKKGEISAFEKNGVLKLYARYSKLEEIMYDLTYTIKGRDRCYYCGRKLTDKNITLDHIYPRSLGGPSIPQNLLPTCKSCNSEKENMTPEQYAVYRKLPNKGLKLEFKTNFSEIRSFQEKWLHVIPDKWISKVLTTSLILLINLEDTQTSKYKSINAYYVRCGQFPKPIVIDCHGFVLDGFTTVLYAKNNGIKEIPTIVLDNVEVIFSENKER